MENESVHSRFGWLLVKVHTVQANNAITLQETNSTVVWHICYISMEKEAHIMLQQQLFGISKKSQFCLINYSSKCKKLKLSNTSELFNYFTHFYDTVYFDHVLYSLIYKTVLATQFNSCTLVLSPPF